MFVAAAVVAAAAVDLEVEQEGTPHSMALELGLVRRTFYFYLLQMCTSSKCSDIM